MDEERRNRVYALFDELGVRYRKVTHPPLFTRADGEAHRVDVGAVIFKNLFLRNKDKSRYYLLSLPLTKRADLAAAARILGETRLSFGDEDALREKLHITRGSVSFLNVIDAKGTDVTFLIDDSAYDNELIGVHPNDNTVTVVFKPEEIPKILEACGAKYRFLDFNGTE